MVSSSIRWPLFANQLTTDRTFGSVLPVNSRCFLLHPFGQSVFYTFSKTEFRKGPVKKGRLVKTGQTVSERTSEDGVSYPASRLALALAKGECCIGGWWALALGQ